MPSMRPQTALAIMMSAKNTDRASNTASVCITADIVLVLGRTKLIAMIDGSDEKNIQT